MHKTDESHYHLKVLDVKTDYKENPEFLIIVHDIFYKDSPITHIEE
jgi:hypothetical protein